MKRKLVQRPEEWKWSSFISPLTKGNCRPPASSNGWAIRQQVDEFYWLFFCIGVGIESLINEQLLGFKMSYLQSSLGAPVSCRSCPTPSGPECVLASDFRSSENLRASFHVADSRESCDPDPTRSPVE